MLRLRSGLPSICVFLKRVILRSNYFFCKSRIFSDIWRLNILAAPSRKWESRGSSSLVISRELSSFRCIDQLEPGLVSISFQSLLHFLDLPLYIRPIDFSLLKDWCEIGESDFIFFNSKFFPHRSGTERNIEIVERAFLLFIHYYVSRKQKDRLLDGKQPTSWTRWLLFSSGQPKRILQLWVSHPLTLSDIAFGV